MAKVDIDLVVHVAQQKLNPTSNELNAFLQELNERAEAAKPKREPACKKKLVFVPMPISAALNTADAYTAARSGWVLQVPENDQCADLFERINVAMCEFNASAKGRRYPVKTLSEALEFVPAKYFKTRKIWVKTKEPCAVETAPERANWSAMLEETEAAE